MYFVGAPLLSPIGIGLLASEWLDRKEAARAEEREQAYLKAPTVGEYFKRVGWKYSELVEWYDDKTAEDIEERYEWFLKLKNMKSHERITHCSNPEILTSINENSFSEIKKRRDWRLMEWALFHKNREEIKDAYGVKIVNLTRQKEDKELNRTLLWIGVIITSFILLVGWLS